MGRENTDVIVTESDNIKERMLGWFGHPNPTETQHTEVFGWYHADNETRYLAYDPVDGSYDVLTSDNQWLYPVLSGEWEEDDLEEIRQCLDSLQFLPRPSFPDDLTVVSRSDPFAYEGWLFAWFFVPELRRWELGVLERRWHVEADRSSEANENSSTREARREGSLTLATKAFEAGVRLFDRYCNSMLLLGSWEPPHPQGGLGMILGAASEAACRYTEQTDVIRLVSRATGCEEATVQSVIGYSELTRLSRHKWFRGAHAIVPLPGFDHF